MSEHEISAAAHPKQTIEVEGRTMAYVEMGEGDPIVFLHGNPTSSYLWRNVMPHLAAQGRCLAPDLIGCGDSDKLPDAGPDSYHYAEHLRYVDGFLEAVGATSDVTLVIHDWGSAYGFDWASRHPDSVKGIAFMEAIVMPVTWDQWPEGAREIFQAFRSDAGEEMCLEQNLFVEAILPGAMIRDLTEEEMDEYRRPFRDGGEGRRPTLSWPRDVPIDGEPAEVVERVQAYGKWLAGSDVPKLLIPAEPGAILTGEQLEFARSWPHTTEADPVEGIHFVQEDSPHEIGRAISGWLAGLEA